MTVIEGSNRRVPGNGWRNFSVILVGLLVLALSGAVAYLLTRPVAPATVAVTPPPAEAPPPPPPHAELPRMKIEAQYGGPLKDTLIQRLRDPADGTICYLYLPMVVHHQPVDALGYVEYGANPVGAISCFAPKS
jgi:hypothetical protein